MSTLQTLLPLNHLKTLTSIARAARGPDFKLKQYCWLTAGTLDTVDHLDELWLRTTFKDDEPWTALPLLRRTGAGVPIAVTRANIAEQRDKLDPPKPVRSHLGVLDALQSDDIHVITAIMDGQSGDRAGVAYDQGLSGAGGAQEGEDRGEEQEEAQAVGRPPTSLHGASCGLAGRTPRGTR